MKIFAIFAFVFFVFLLSEILCADRCCSSEQTCIHTCDAYRSNGNCLPGPTGKPGVSTIPICSYMNDEYCTQELNGICSQSSYEEVCKERYGTPPKPSGSSSKDDCCPNAVICKNSCESYRSNNNTFPGPLRGPGVSTIPICRYLNDEYCNTRLGKLCSQPGYQRLCEEYYRN